MIFSKRRAELAAENDYWFDLGELNFAVAKAKWKTQDRGQKLHQLKFLLYYNNIYPYPANEHCKIKE
jgi:hypothetical protein